jgi:hypothetical protein
VRIAYAKSSYHAMQIRPLSGKPASTRSPTGDGVGWIVEDATRLIGPRNTAGMGVRPSGYLASL